MQVTFVTVHVCKSGVKVRLGYIAVPAEQGQLG